jgi:hypothetical protein
VVSVETAAEQDGIQVQLKMAQHMVWSYYLTDADAPTYACTPSHLCSSPAQEPCSPSLGSSQNPEPPRHRPIHYSSHSENSLATSHQYPLYLEHIEKLSELGDVLIHNHGPLFQILELLLLQLNNPLGNMMCTESSSKFWPVDAFGFLMGFHISIPPIGCRTRKLERS